MQKFTRKIWKLILLFRDHVTGELAYQNYLKRCGRKHPQGKIISKKEFLRNHEKSKWDNVNRCC